MLSYVASPMRMQFVEPFICGLLRMKIERRLPTRPRMPTPLSRTDGTRNSKMKSTSGSVVAIVSFKSNNSVVLFMFILECTVSYSALLWNTPILALLCYIPILALLWNTPILALLCYIPILALLSYITLTCSCSSWNVFLLLFLSFHCFLLSTALLYYSAHMLLMFILECLFTASFATMSHSSLLCYITLMTCC